MNFFIALAVLVATCIQAVTSAKDLGQARKEAARWMGAEDDLIAEVPWRRRRGARRELRAERPEHIHRGIRHVEWVLGSWVLLGFASLLGVFGALGVG